MRWLLTSALLAHQTWDPQSPAQRPDGIRHRRIQDAFPFSAVTMMLRSILFLTAVASVVAYQPNTSRRHVFQTAAAAAFLPASSAFAIDACPPKSQNCIRTTWTPPNKDANLLEILESYPQTGQNKADLGGWTLVENKLPASAKLEYKSGIGNFAKFLNGGKPFVDDLVIEKAGDVYEVRSSSRIGESDLGVNQKRLTYLAEALRAKGWTVPDPKY